ncbi:MAG TPA: phospholipase D-like domain-containing protein [Gemmatimonadaceae bacterium]|nr:phospholipase D-like domain-containing protein [Gemmatimonadaceae bacterium]
MWAIILAVIATAVVMTIARNLIPASRGVNYELAEEDRVGSPQFARDMGNLLGPPLVAGNRLTTLRNGDAIFPAMLEAIRSAQKSITFETFIYWSGEIGEEFADALAERSRAGVHVHVLLDWLGAKKMEERLLDHIVKAGADVHRYHRVKWHTLDKLNNRTHRKLLVVDGHTGFTGGVGIADPWQGDAQDEDHWRDTHYRLEGPAVAHLQAAFMDNWLQTSGEVLSGELYFPKLESLGECCAQVFKSSAREGSESVRLMFIMSFAAARDSILIESAYFVPDDRTIAELIAARKRGVTVEIIVPGPIIDTQVVRAASRSRWGPLLEAGVWIGEYQPTMLHCKLMIVDDMWVSVGSTNLDGRSLRLNDEANLNVLDKDFAREQREMFEADRAQSRQVTLAEWQRRPVLVKVRETMAGWFRSQM